MAPSRLWTLAVLAASASAQFASYSTGGYSLSVNVPANTASTDSGSIFLQISAPKGTQWVSFGQGSQMRGSNMFIVYAASSSNVTVSPRLGVGQVQPNFNSNAQISILSGTGVNSDGSMIANIRCDSCLKWSGGSMSPTDTSSSWIWAYKAGSALDSTSTSANIAQHDSSGSFSLDLTTGTGGSSANPFSTATTSGSASSSASGSAASSTGGVSNPVATTSPGSTSAGSTTRTDTTSIVRISHAVILSMIFLVFFPLAALTMYLPYAQRVQHVHAPLQILSLVLLIVGLALGVVLCQRIGLPYGYHQLVGFVVAALLVLFQPALGIYQHMYYRKSGGRSPLGIVHKWLGRCVIILGVINGGLGLMQSGPTGNRNVPGYSVVAYGVVAGVVFIVYLSVIIGSLFSSKRAQASRAQGKSGRTGFEMRSPSASPQSTSARQHQNAYRQQTQNYHSSRQEYR